MSENPNMINSSSSEAPGVEASRTIVASNLETANLIEGYHVIAEWIRFADAKAAVVLTVGGAIAGLVIPTLKSYLDEDSALHPTVWWTTMVSSPCSQSRIAPTASRWNSDRISDASPPGKFCRAIRST